MTKKELRKKVAKLVNGSFKDGRMLEHQVTGSIKALKFLPRHEAIHALLEYLKGIRRIEREHTLYIETVVPLSPAQIKKVKKLMEKKAEITKVLVSINPEILGGFKLKVGDEIWDESILGGINQVKEVISG
ncbi:MAG: F0F1 ATP synthase subunit delta [Candidatus Daviesbacteria bacterium]|nr:F0F1 ATP synthase subunit delta [Candidatus Daviesbacteria bacterium]